MKEKRRKKGSIKEQRNSRKSRPRRMVV